MRLHDGQLDVDESVVRRLIAQQFPQWRAEPVRLWYYRESNPEMSALGRSTLKRILGDTEIRAPRAL